MTALKLTKPTVFIMLGYPGSGKTFFARQFSKQINAMHLSSDRIRFELFEQPRFSAEETDVVNRLLNYIFEEAISAGISVVFDANNNRRSQRNELLSKTQKIGGSSLIVWVQTDRNTAQTRSSSRDRRNPDDKYSYEVPAEAFERLSSNLTVPSEREDYVVISGKHVFKNQLHVVVQKLLNMDLIDLSQFELQKRATLGGRYDPIRRKQL